MRYKVIKHELSSSSGQETFEDDIKEMLDDGWDLVGGVSSFQESYGHDGKFRTSFIQALFKD